MLVERFVAVILAPVTAAPLGSKTVPVIEPETAWPFNVDDRESTSPRKLAAAAGMRDLNMGLE